MADDFEIGGDELAELREFFFAQATETIDSLGELILRVERDPSDAESLRSIRRAVHTLKGDSTAFGFSELTDIAHRYEDALDRLRAREGAASRELINLLLAGSDALAAFITYYRGEGDMPDVTELVAGLAALNETGDPAATQRKPAKTEKKQKSKASEIEAAEVIAPTAEPAVVAPVAEVPAAVINNDVEQAEAEAGEEAGEATGDRRANTDRRQGDRRQSQTAFLRVESDRIDAAMNLVGELMIQRSMVTTLASEIESSRRGD
ncbi:MAG TPA: Hpt domain-containing protein, partial [Blastocatellia bacterium]|nr:Hpt domain-containing protein [Blastocatellia bacterium]